MLFRSVRATRFRFDDDGLKLGQIAGVLELVVKIVLGDSETFRNCGQILFNEFRVIAKEKNAERWSIVYEYAPIAIEHAATRRDDGNRTDAILFGHLAILIAVDDLQLPEAQEQQADHAYDDVGDDCEPRLRQPIVIAEPVRHKFFFFTSGFVKQP